MARRFRQLVLAIGCVLLAPQLILADDGLTLESLAEKVGSLFQGQDDLKKRVAAIETQIAPTPTRTRRPTPTPRPGVTATTRAKLTATAQARTRATATRRAAYAATEVARVTRRAVSARATATAKVRTEGCSFSDSTIPDPPYTNLDCETWKAAFILAEIEYGRISRSQLREVAELVYPMVATGARYCGVSASRLADYVAVTAQQLMKLGKPSASPDNAITYVLMYVSSTVFEETVEVAGCEQTLSSFIVLSD